MALRFVGIQGPWDTPDLYDDDEEETDVLNQCVKEKKIKPGKKIKPEPRKTPLLDVLGYVKCQWRESNENRN